ncbi:MAG: hypothetical protein PHO75_04360, partial [Candidatus Shapirobacteria bacterium]|nr:hypothetical protein [Candidatus Shapirobacteria bacterium]
YRIEKKNAFDPSKLHQREPYREDSFELQATLNPDEYYTLLSFITATGNLYLEYNAYNTINSQFPVTISQLPKCPDDLHEYPTKIKLSLESRYIGSPGYIDFNIIIIDDDGDTVTNS